jgi:hypothetical protein
VKINIFAFRFIIVGVFQVLLGFYLVMVQNKTPKAPEISG